MEMETEPPFFGSAAYGVPAVINRAIAAATKVVSPIVPALVQVGRDRVMGSSLNSLLLFFGAFAGCRLAELTPPVAKILNLIKKCK
jgi:hypothetical protein